VAGVERTGAAVALEDPQPQAARAPSLRGVEQSRPDPLALRRRAHVEVLDHVFLQRQEPDRRARAPDDEHLAFGEHGLAEEAPVLGVRVELREPRYGRVSSRPERGRQGIAVRRSGALDRQRYGSRSLPWVSS
jgi:hypothetical protein